MQVSSATPGPNTPLLPMNVSVIIPTHNPCAEYLGRVLEALRTQTLPLDRWELILIDNASKVPLKDIWDLTWHPAGRHIREESLGLTPARLRGIAASTADIILFVDDDNLLAPNYLEEGLHLLNEHKKLGAIGAGRILPEYEEAPADVVTTYVNMLTLCDVNHDSWGNPGKWGHHVPAGAGMFIRREVGTYYSKLVGESELRRALDRRGDSLSSSGDVDLALCACDLGLGCGVFRPLEVRHLIPKQRVQMEYLLKLAEEKECSSALLNFVRLGEKPTQRLGAFGAIRHLWALARLPPASRRYYAAGRRGVARAATKIESLSAAVK